MIINSIAHPRDHIPAQRVLQVQPRGHVRKYPCHQLYHAHPKDKGYGAAISETLRGGLRCR